MKTGKLFWGILFVSLGALSLLNYFNINLRISVDNEVVIPVLLVLLGIALLFKQQAIKFLFIILAAILSAFALFDIFWEHTNYNCHDDDIEFRIFEKSENKDMVEYNSDVEKAVLNLSAFGSNIKVKGIDTQDYILNLKDSKSSHKIKSRVVQNKAIIDVNPYNHKEDPDEDNVINLDSDLDFFISNDFNWDFDFSSGASELKLDLRDTPVHNIEIKSAVSELTLILGENQNLTNVDLDIAASEILIKIPKNTGCLVTSHTIFMEKKLPGFNHYDEHTYTSENFDSSSKKVKIDLKSAINKLEIKFY